MDPNFLDPGMVFAGEPDIGHEPISDPVFNNFEDPFADLHATNGSLQDDIGLDCEIKCYEARWNAKGDVKRLQVGKMRKMQQLSQEKSVDYKAAMVLTKYFDKLDEIERTELRIQSPHIKKALREVIHEYPGINLNAPTILIRGLPKCLFHYRKELADYGRTVQDLTAVQHLEFVLSYTYRQLNEQALSYHFFMETPSLAPGLEESNLWMAFRPGDLIFTMENNTPVILRFDTMSGTGNSRNDSWTIQASSLDSDGNNFGYRTRSISISSYENYKPLTELKAYPLEFHPEKQQIVASLRERGRKFVSFQGIHYRSYSGSVQGSSPFDSRESIDDGTGVPKLQYSTSVNERIIIDTRGFHSNNPRNATWFKKKFGSRTDTNLEFEDEHLLICSHEVPAFSLSSRRWWKVKVDEIKEIEFNADAFDKLILPGGQKEMIHSLVNVHSHNRLKFDDVIAGKGRGMVFLLHGESGTGKTLTAESVADYTKRPLYVVGCADLGTNIDTVERSLTKILRVSTEWNAILLLDEADVFLERRNNRDLERSGLVSVFLRVLEYFEGILFLTTNRISVFDKAVKSRVHMAIKFPKLNMESRRQLWITFIEKAAAGSALGWCDDALLDQLAEAEINGRQIKNAVRTAHVLAVSRNEDLRPHHLRVSLDSLTQFDTQLESDLMESPEDAPTPVDFGRHPKRRRLF